MRRYILKTKGVKRTGIITLTNQDARLLRAVRALCDSTARQDDRVFFYYGGHGSQSSGGDSRLTALLDAIEGAADKDAYYSQEGVDQLSNVRTQTLPPPLYALCSRLTQLLALSNPSDPSYPRGARYLRRMCQKAGLVPTSCIVSKEVVRSSTEPSRSNFSDVWKGSLDGAPVEDQLMSTITCALVI
jgi:hypothetical protein